MDNLGVLRCALRASQQSTAALIYNKNVPFEFILKYPNGLNNVTWSMYDLSRCSKLPFDYVIANPFGFNGIKWCTPLRVANFAT